MGLGAATGDLLGHGYGSFPCFLVVGEGGDRDRQAARKKIYTVKLKPVWLSWVYIPISTSNFKHPRKFVVNFQCLPVNPQAIFCKLPA